MYRLKSKFKAFLLCIPLLIFCHGCGGEEEQVKIDPVRRISIKDMTAAMIDQDGKLWTWGDHRFGLVGDGYSIGYDSDDDSDESIGEPFSPADSVRFSCVSIGYTLLAIDDEGTLWGCGLKAPLCYEVNPFPDSRCLTTLTPLSCVEGVKFSAICNYAACLALDTDGNLWAWKGLDTGALSDGTCPFPNLPEIIVKDRKFSRIAMGHCYSYFAIDEEGGLWSWGSCHNGELGNGSVMTHEEQLFHPIKEPQRVCEGVLFQDVYATPFSTYAIDRDGHLWATGNNRDGQLGDGTKTNALEFTRVKSNRKFVKVGGSEHADEGFAFAIDEDGGLWFMGDRASISEWDEYQKLDEDQRKLTTPLRVMEDVRFVDISETGELALADNGDLYVLLSNWSNYNRLTHWVEEGTSVKRPLIIFP